MANRGKAKRVPGTGPDTRNKFDLIGAPRPPFGCRRLTGQPPVQPGEVVQPVRQRIGDGGDLSGLVLKKHG